MDKFIGISTLKGFHAEGLHQRRRREQISICEVRCIGVRRVKILSILFSIFLISCAVPVRSSKPQAEQIGFRDIKWGTEISTLTDMERVREETSNSDLVWYTRRGDTLAIGKAKLKNIFYAFWMGNFESVWIDFEGDENFEVLKKELFERFGEVRESVK
ncbi:MAG TPA: hypothetical protein VLK23_19295, partial [Thermodesulfobacteriota bacterium]|nr:hypothetical protein [Thermodesulfobacteriota bacterium]